MPENKLQPAPDFIPAEEPDFIPAEGETAAPDSRNKIQKAFDELTTVTPEQEQGHSWLTNKAQEFGAGTLQSLSPLFHPVDTATGLVKAFSHPVETAKAVAADSLEHPAQVVGNLLGGAVTGGLAAEVGAPLIAKIPTKARAGELFNRVNQAAQHEPVTLTHAAPSLQRLAELGTRGGVMPRAAEQLLNRSQWMEPIRFPEARDFYSNISRLSGDEASKMTPPVAAEIGKLRHAFNQDLEGAATRAGRGSEYSQAMQTYRQAARNAEIAKKVAKWGGAAAAGGVGLEGAHRLIKAFTQ